MLRIGAWGLAAAITAGITGSTASGGDDAPNPGRSSRPPTTLFKKLFGSSKAKDKSVARASAAPTVVAPLPPEVVAAALQAEREAWARRMAVCNKLRSVAIEANDESMMRQVDELERQAADVYKARTAALGFPKVKLASGGSSAAGKARSVKAAARKLSAPDSPTAIDPAVRTAEARTSIDVVREVRP